MSYSRRQLYAMGETFGDSATRMEAGGRIVYGGGGGGSPAPQPTTTITESEPTVTNRTTANEIPQYLTNASQDLIAKGAALTSRPYEAYTGARVSEFSPLMTQAFDRIGGQQVAGQVGEATGLASLAGQRAMDYGQFQTGVQQYMNPYMQGVVDIERRKAQEAADQQAAVLSGQAARQGAFGGSGVALQQRALRRDTAQQLGDIQTQGLDRAYQSAVGQYNQGIAGGLQAAGQLGQLGQTQFGQQMDITQGLGMAGDVQRQREQALLDVGYGDYLTAQKYPYEQLAFQQGLISGVPYSTTQRTNEVSTPGKQVSQQTATPAAGPSAASQVAGAGLAAYGAFNADDPYGSNAANRAAGGEIKSYAGGGIASLSDAQIGMRQQMPNITELARMSLEAEAQRRAQLRLAAEAQQAQMGDQPTVADEEMAMLEQGIGGLDVPDDLVGDEGMAGGGIVAFDGGGYVPFYQRAYQQGEEKGSIYDPYFGLPAEERESRRLEDEAKANALRSSQVADLQAGNRAAFVGSAQKEIDDLVSNRAEMVRRFGQKQYDQKLQKLSQGLLSTEQRFDQRQQAQAQAAQQAASVLENARAAQSAAKPVANSSGIASVVDGSDSRFARGPVAKGISDQPPAVATAPAAEPSADRAVRSGAPGATPVGGIMGLLDKEGARRIAAQKGITESELAGVATDRLAIDEARKEAEQFGSDREARLKKREEGMKGAEDRNFNMTLVEAGLAIMAGQSSNALTNIALGATQGLKGYQSRLEKIEAGREKLDESMSRLYELRQEKVSAVGKELRALNREENQIKTQGLRAQEEIASGISGEKIKLTKEQAEEANRRAFDVWKINRTEKDANTRENIAAARTLASTAQKIIDDQEGIYSDAEKAAARNDLSQAMSMMRGQSYTVTVNGKTYGFPTKQAADDFKKQAGVK